MSQAQESLHDQANRKPSPTPAAAKLFFPLAAIVIMIIGFIGFSRFYLHGTAYPDREIPPPIKGLVIAHGVVMSAWLMLLLIQPSLILARRRKLHMKLGRVGAGLAALVVIFGLLTAVRSAQVTPPDLVLWGMSPKQFMAVSTTSIVVFAAFVTLGVVFRRTAHVHRSMMILGTLFLLPAAFDRIDPLKNLYLGTFWADIFGPYFMTLILGILLVAVRSVLARKFDAVFAVGTLILIVLAAITMKIGPTSAWDTFASIFVK